MTTYQILVDILERITAAYSAEVESLAECVSMNATGSYTDMTQEDIDAVLPGRELVAEARAVLESINLGTEHIANSERSRFS